MSSNPKEWLVIGVGSTGTRRSHQAYRPLGKNRHHTAYRNIGMFGSHETRGHPIRYIYGGFIGDSVRDGRQIGGGVIDMEVLRENPVFYVGELPGVPAKIE
jgi:hypothetical protein